MQYEPASGALPIAAPFSAPAEGIEHQDLFGQRTRAREHFVTDGEKKFNRLTYTTIGYVANVLMSVGAVFWVERTHSGQKTMNQFVDWTKKVLPSVNPETSKMLATKSFFLSGGFAALAPMKFLEDHKIALVKKWNKEIYGDAVETDPTLVQSQKELASAPTQGWASIFSSRMLALVPFYATVALMWEGKSVLGRATNPELRALGKDAAKALEQHDPARYHQIASKGVYFDRPIAAASRAIGKAWAKIAGNTEAVARLETMEAQYPGMIKQGPMGSLDRDTHHSSIPYYFISEAITSGMVAWGVFALSRILAPLIGKKHEAPAVAEITVSQIAVPEPAQMPQVALPAVPVQLKTAPTVQPLEQPTPTIQTKDSVYEARQETTTQQLHA